MRTDLALDAVEMGLWTRQRQGRDVTGPTHHSDKGVQYVAARYAQRLAEAELEDTYYRHYTAPATAET